MTGRAGEDVYTGLVEYGRVVGSRWRWIAWGALFAVVVMAVVLILLPPLYRSEARILVRTPGDVSHVIDGGDSYAQGRARTYAALASSSSVAARVIADLGLDLEPHVLSARVYATNPPGTALINIAVSAPSSAEAQRTATVLVDEYAETVHTLEAVPGSMVPRAELVVVDPPGKPVQVFALGAPMSVILPGAILIGMLLGSLAAVLQSILARSADDISVDGDSYPPLHLSGTSRSSTMRSAAGNGGRHRVDIVGRT